MTFIKKHIYILAALVLFSACKPDIKTPALTKGSADFSRYISIGNSLTAGYADGGLYLAGQQVSYPSIIANQMKSVGGGTFTQPLFDAAQANGSGYLTLAGLTKTGLPITASVTSNLAIRDSIVFFGHKTILYTKYTGGDINNFGVPGIKLNDLNNPYYGNLNGFFERLLPGNAPANTATSYLQFITAKPFTFFSNWLGNNDALGYATSGGAGDLLTDTLVFKSYYQQLITALTSNKAKGVVATVPDVTSIPYFNTVTTGAVLVGVQQALPQANIKALYINALSSPSASGYYSARPATSKDLLILTFNTGLLGQPVAAAGGLPYGLTPYTPIDNQYVLDQNEVILTQTYVNSFNNTIKSVAASNGLAVFDAYTFLNNIKANGLLEDGVSLNSNYISGGIFSLDGVHLTPRGYAIVANEFIKAINSKYGSNIPLTNITNYTGVKFP